MRQLQGPAAKAPARCLAGPQEADDICADAQPITLASRKIHMTSWNCSSAWQHGELLLCHEGMIFWSVRRSQINVRR